MSESDRLNGELDDAIRAHYEQAAAESEAAVERVRATIEAEDKALAMSPLDPDVAVVAAGATGFTSWRRWALSVTAAAVIGLAVGAAIMHTQASEDRLERVAKEVAFNYVRQLPDEIRGRKLGAHEITTPNRTEERIDFGHLPFLMRTDALGFTPVKPQEGAFFEGFELAGARYCTLGDRMAVQLRIVDDMGRHMTLYQFLPTAVEANLPTEISGNPALQVAFTIDGVGVMLWREQGLVMALAYPDTRGH